MPLDGGRVADDSRIRAAATGSHRGPKNLNVQGVPVDGYLGLPVLSVVIQEFTNFSTGGNYGNTTLSDTAQTILLPCE